MQLNVRLRSKLYSFLLALFVNIPAFAGTTHDLWRAMDGDACGLWVQTHRYKAVMKGDWERNPTFENLKSRFFKDGVPDMIAWEAYKIKQPGRWLRTTSGRNVRIMYLESEKPSNHGNYTIGGIDASVEHYLVHHHQYVERMDDAAYDVMVETGGLTDFDEFMRTGGNPRRVISMEEVSADIYEAIEHMQRRLKIINPETPISEKVNIIGISAGGWTAQYFAAHPRYNHIINQIILQAPGGQSLDEYYNAFIRPAKDLAEAIHPLQQAFVSAFNHNAKQSLRWMRAFGWPVAEEAPQLKTLHEMTLDQYEAGVKSSLRAAFPAFAKDELRLRFVTARIMGLAKAEGEKLILQIPRDIVIHGIFSGADHIVPPGLSAKLIRAMHRRDELAQDGKITYTALYFPGMMHNQMASDDFRIAAATAGFMRKAKGYGPMWIDREGQLESKTIEEIATALQQNEQHYIETNRALLQGIPMQQ